jgi:hypothetical protein
MKRSGKSLTQDVSKTQVLGTLSMVAMICDDGTLQHHLPQIVFINKSHISQTDFDYALQRVQHNVHLFRVANPWTTGEKMKLIFKLLADSVRKHSEKTRVIVCADGYKAHLGRNTWASAAAHGFFYFIIPPKLTWALQPCDTHLFAIFKDALAKQCQKLLLASGQQKLSILTLLDALNNTVEAKISASSWSKAFDDLGYGGHQRLVSRRCMQKLDMVEVPEVGNAIPTLANLMACFPQRTDIPIGSVFSAVVRAHRLNASYDNQPELQPHVACMNTSASLVDDHIDGVRVGGNEPAICMSHYSPSTEGVRRPPLTPMFMPRLVRLPSCRLNVAETTSCHEPLPPLPPPQDERPNEAG